MNPSTYTQFTGRFAKIWSFVPQDISVELAASQAKHTLNLDCYYFDYGLSDETNFSSNAMFGAGKFAHYTDFFKKDAKPPAKMLLTTLIVQEVVSWDLNNVNLLCIGVTWVVDIQGWGKRLFYDAGSNNEVMYPLFDLDAAHKVFIYNCWWGGTMSTSTYQLLYGNIAIGSPDVEQQAGYSWKCLSSYWKRSLKNMLDQVMNSGPPTGYVCYFMMNVKDQGSASVDYLVPTLQEENEVTLLAQTIYEEGNDLTGHFEYTVSGFHNKVYFPYLGDVTEFGPVSMIPYAQYYTNDQGYWYFDRSAAIGFGYNVWSFFMIPGVMNEYHTEIGFVACQSVRDRTFYCLYKQWSEPESPFEVVETNLGNENSPVTLTPKGSTPQEEGKKDEEKSKS